MIALILLKVLAWLVGLGALVAAVLLAKDALSRMRYAWDRAVAWWTLVLAFILAAVGVAVLAAI
jgi:hypothetical protein